MLPQDRYGIVKGLEVSSGAGLHQTAFEHGQYEAGQTATVGAAGQSVSGVVQPNLHTRCPILEVLMDQIARYWISVAHFESQVADRAAHAAALLAHSLAILREECEDSFQRIGGGGFDGMHHGLVQVAEGELQDTQQEFVFAREKMIHAAWIYFRLAEDGRDARGVEALLVEKLESRAEDTLFSIERGRVLSGHSRMLSDRSSCVKT